MSNVPDRLYRRKHINRRPSDVGYEAARIMIIRAVRHADLHHALLGHACIIGFVIPNGNDGETFVEAGREILRAFAANDILPDWDVLHWEAAKRSRTSEAAVKESLIKHGRVFGFAANGSDFSATFRLAADAIISTDPVDLSALTAAFHSVLGRAPPPDMLSEALRLPLGALGVGIKRGRSPEYAIRRLRRLHEAELGQRASAPAPSRAPSLDDLHGLGEAAVWGQALAVDLFDYRAGRIAWSDVDRGVLVSGPSGTGKTTFAQALARTCHVPIHIHSLGRWQAKGYLNELLKAMSAAFDEAKKAAPCILFLDELDSFGDRETAEGHNAQYNREVINAFLECLDGVEGREGVVVVGATNFPDKIDAAIRRPGRLDKHVRIPLPDRTARQGILRHHLGESLVGVDFADVAERLEGASGAVIEQVVRDARRKARTERRELALEDISGALPSRVRQNDPAFRRTCVHEAGHAIVGHILTHESGSSFEETKVFRDITMNGTGGETTFHRCPGIERTKTSYMAEITTWLAGLAAEAVILGEYGDGGGGATDSDLHRATVIAAGLEASLGLGEGLIYLSSTRADHLVALVSRDPGLRRRVENILRECSERAKGLLRERLEGLNDLARSIEIEGRITMTQLSAMLQRSGHSPRMHADAEIRNDLPCEPSSVTSRN